MKWRVYIEPGLDIDKIKKALSMVPSYFEFEVHGDPAEWNGVIAFATVYDSGDWRGFIIPEQDNTIIIFDGKRRNVKFAGGTIGNRIGVAVFGNESVETLYLRIYHELLHALGLPADDMPNNSEFVEWLTNMLRIALYVDKKLFYSKFINNPKWQNLYYTYLLLKYVEGG